MLTEREQECIALTWFGLRNKEIAPRMGTTTPAIRSLLARAYERLGLTRAGDPRTRAALRLIRECERAAGIRLGERARGDDRAIAQEEQRV